jgi:hypothetical protein
MIKFGAKAHNRSGIKFGGKSSKGSGISFGCKKSTIPAAAGVMPLTHNQKSPLEK